MEALISALLAPMLSSGNPAFTALLLLVAAGLAWYLIKREANLRRERKELIDQFQKTIESDREDLLEVIDKYQEGQISVIQAINEIKVLIATIGAKL